MSKRGVSGKKQLTYYFLFFYFFNLFKNRIRENVCGTFNVTRLAAGLIGKNEPDENGLRGVVINTCGVEAFRGTEGQVAGSASSGAITSMEKAMASDVGVGGIRVVAIAPGIIRTELNDHFPAETNESIVNECLVAPNRMGDPDEFAQMVQSIVMNPFINATTIEISAG